MQVPIFCLLLLIKQFLHLSIHDTLPVLMFQAVGKRVIYLKRIKMGPIPLDETLEPGEYRELTDEEIALLKGEDKK